MAEEYGVFATTPTASETQAARLFRRFTMSGVVPPGGVDGGEGLEVTADGTSAVTVGTGYCIAGGYWYRNTSPLQVPITANASGMPRMDLLVVRADPAADECSLEWLVGTPGSGDAPAPTRTSDDIWEEPLAVLTLPAGATSAGPGSVAMARNFSAAGGAVVDLDGAGHDTLPPGGLRLASDGRLLVRDGSGVDRLVAHTGYPTAWQPLTLRSGYQQASSGHAPAWRWDAPGLVRLRGTITRSNGQPLPTGDYVATVPAAIRPSAFVRYVCPAHATGPGWSVRGEIRPTAATNPGQLVIWHQYSPEWMALDGWTYPI
ncbi:MAG: hypothetical protein IRZ07_17100 [Microbispora sp.]|nr:hypothetical protein [Microbispora sp.]